jgi:hypothetical protein
MSPLTFATRPSQDKNAVASLAIVCNLFCYDVPTLLIQLLRLIILDALHLFSITDAFHETLLFLPSLIQHQVSTLNT